MSGKSTEFTHSSGNVFADLGLPESEQLLRKADLVVDISLAIERRRLSVSDVSALLHLSEAQVAELMQEASDHYSVACLQHYLEIMRGAEALPVSPVASALCV